MSAKTEYRYNRLTWPEMNDAIEMQKLIILPTGSTEQHGPHLPLETDEFLCETVCLEVGKRIPDKVLVLPPISYGLNMHHFDFPGTIHIEPETFIAFGLNITKSLAYHGFKKILIVNGHGSNGPLVDLIARKTVLATESLCFATSYFNFVVEEFEKVRESEVIAHADELETSLYLHLAGDRVRFDLAEADNDHVGKYVSSDSTSPYVRFNDYWGRWTVRGVHGDPTVATKEKGKIIFDAAVNGLVDLIDELRDWPVEKRSDQHKHPVQSQIQF